jgi:NADH:ubiquinone oxidoreductase subunit F (NADH-binding)
LKLIGSMLGAAFVVIGDRACVVDMALNTTQFFRNESCGKCVPCRVGSQKLVKMLTDLVAGQITAEGFVAFPELAQTMVDTSICGLGMVASNPLASVLTHFRAEFDAHIQDRRCPAGVCEALARPGSAP